MACWIVALVPLAAAKGAEPLRPSMGPGALSSSWLHSRSTHFSVVVVCFA